MDERESIIELLQSQSTLTLATIGEDALPRAASLFYLPGEEFELYWFSSGNSEHSRNVERRSEAAVTVAYPTDQWREIRGLQMRGRVSMVDDNVERERITRSYIQRFQLGTVFATAIRQSTLYLFRPSWVRYIDNSRGFGFKWEWTR